MKPVSRSSPDHKELGRAHARSPPVAALDRGAAILTETTLRHRLCNSVFVSLRLAQSVSLYAIV